MAQKMRLGLGQFSELSEERLKFIKQLGVEDVLLNTPQLPGTERWEFMDIPSSPDRDRKRRVTVSGTRERACLILRQSDAWLARTRRTN